MPLASTDLIFYASANMPTDDVTSSGGAIDPKRRVVFVEQSTGTIEVVSDNAADTQNCTVVGRLDSGLLVTETLALTGVTPKVFVNSYERLLSVDLVSDAIGTVTVRKSGAGAAYGTIPVGERGFVRMFRNSISSSISMSRYEKLFIKNVHATLDLLTAIIGEAADPSAKMSFTLASAVDDSNSVATRLTAPGAAIIEPDAFSSSPKGVPGGTLLHGSAIGVWIKQTLSAVNAPLESSFTPLIYGVST